MNRSCLTWLSSALVMAYVIQFGGVAAAEMALRGTATYSTGGNEWAYMPGSQQVRQADDLAKLYKLGGAEAAYQRMLDRNVHRAEALNGLGKVAYYQTASSAAWIRGEREEHLERAKRYFTEAVTLKPNYAEAWLNLGQMHLEFEELDLAEEVFTKVLEMRGLSYRLQAEANLKLGQTLLMRQQANEALPYLEAAAKMLPKSVSAHYYLSRAYMQRGEYNNAYEQLQAGLHNDPNHPKLYEQLGILHEQTGNAAAAITAYQRALMLKPELTLANEQLVAQYEARGDMEFALAYLKNHFSGASDKPLQEQADIANRVGELALKGHQPEVAKRYFGYAQQAGDMATRERAARGLSESELQLAKSFYQAPYGNDTEGAYQSREALANALKANPNNLKAQRMRLDMEAKQQPEGFHTVSYNGTQYQNAMNNTPSSPSELFSQGEMLVDRYQYQLAEKRFALSIQAVSFPSDAMTLGDMMLKLGLLDQADESYRRATRLGAAPQMTSLGVNRVADARRRSEQALAQAQYYIKKQKKNPEIEAELLKAMRLDQQNPLIHLELAEFYEKQERNAPAVDHYFAVLQLDPDNPKRERIIRKMEKLSAKKKA